MNLRLSQAGHGASLHEVKALEEAGWGPQGPAGGQAGNSRRAPGLSAELGLVGWSAAQAQQLTRYIPVGVGP